MAAVYGEADWFPSFYVRSQSNNEGRLEPTPTTSTPGTKRRDPLAASIKRRLNLVNSSNGQRPKCARRPALNMMRTYKTSSSRRQALCIRLLVVLIYDWLSKIAKGIQDENDEYVACYETDVRLLHSPSPGKKVPDVLLKKRQTRYPVIAVEVGVSEPLTKLFEDAERIFSGSRNTDLVILINIEEHGTRTNGSPWGLTDEDIRGMQDADCLADKILKWHQDHSCPLVGSFTAEIYFYWKDVGHHHQHRPTQPLWTYRFTLDGPVQEGRFTTTTSFSRYLTEDGFRFRFHGKEFPLPLKRMEEELKASLAEFEVWRSGEFASKKWKQVHGSQEY
ncbi:hypothetical protein T310_1376 [Rasamsonia emersonii CBS 393.64]|uniref:Uncharacterized protein n=1 Tax=Rasamsonia emersonii (strain ATCC 16479 / CBS 393.64 / IMI 116815) TaxID=1408163 RepID=A0A0F4Z3W8_RASE3|nr:hypothetical protein T310_1376 [Rasamsonia emersonii CBS 393.64]KKA24588.1 hypothetical protein T310_1376 [Rasamsonia emersonii CBS 393.64]